MHAARLNGSVRFCSIGFKVCLFKFFALNSLGWICVSAVLSNLFRIFIKKEPKQRLSSMSRRNLLRNSCVPELLSSGEQTALLKYVGFLTFLSPIMTAK